MITVQVIEAFEHELTKVAFSAVGKLLGRAVSGAVPAIQDGARGAWSALRSPALARTGAGAFGGAGAGALGGAVLGAGEGAIRSYSEAKDQGHGFLDSLSAGSIGSIRGALHRGGEGALLGAAAGGVGSALSKGLPATLAKLPGLGAGARFGERQFHGLTGWTPEAGIRSIRGGAYGAQKTLEDAASSLRAARESGGSIAGAQKSVDQALKGFEASSRAEGMGLTSLPGYAKSLIKDPKGTLAAGFGEQWHGQSTGGKAMTVGLTGLGVANEVRNRDKSEEGAGQATGKALGGALPWMMGPLPTAAGLALTPAMALAGGMAGKGVDLLRRRLVGSPPAPGPSDADSASSPTERVYSDRAMGMPEGSVG
jgi:hypothetical protein